MSVCVSCDEPLVIRVDQGESEAEAKEELVPDELLLPCGCLFHWQCLLDSAAEVALSLKCPSCEAYLPQNQPGPSATNTIFQAESQAAVILTRYHSEGGVQEGFDIMPYLTEEAYLVNHPEAAPARAFHTLCTEGDVDGIIEVISDARHPEEANSLSPEQLIRYQDPLNGMKSGLHLAIEADQVSVTLLLLYLASGLPESFFPVEALQVAQQHDLHHPQLSSPEDDIRALKDSQGRTAEEYASRVGGRWTNFIGSGMFA